jgi:hypothetical protein
MIYFLGLAIMSPPFLAKFTLCYTRCQRYSTLVEFGRLHPEKEVTHRYHGMDKIPESLEMMGGKDRSVIKPVVFFD